jgi:glycosyltransferase involved in cell wall biosynthesis
MREIAPDVIVSFLPHVNVAAVLAASGLGIPVVVSERTYPPAMPLGRGLEILRRYAYPRAAHVIVQTQRSLGWLQDCCPKARGHVIPNMVVYPLPAAELSQDPASVVHDARRVGLAVGRLSEEKGFDQLISAFGLLAQSYADWDLVILGEGPERERLEVQCGKLGLSDRIYFPGRVGNPGDWYARADLYVMSSSFEGFPNTLTEAMAHGLPAVSLDCETGPADIIRDGVDGYLVPLDQGAEGLSRAMATLMSDDARREKMGCAAISVRERFSPERVMAAWDQILGLRQENCNV